MIRLITYNIHRGEGMDGRLDLERTASVLRDLVPDIVCLQEVDVDQPRSQELDFPAQFSAMLGMEYAFGDNFQFDGGHYGNATLSHLPLEYIENFPLPVPDGAEPRGCLHVRITTPQGPLRVFNTHLSYNDAPRLPQAERIVEKLAEAGADTSTLLVGDLNDPDSAPAIRRLQSVLRDSFTPHPEALGHTFPSNALERRIDYVLCAPDIQIRASRPLNTPKTRLASDHLPWIIDFDIAPED